MQNSPHAYGIFLGYNAKVMQLSPANVFLLSLVAAAIPALVYSTVIYWFDHYEKEPGWLLTATFIWGAVPSVILAIIASLLLSAPLQLVGGPAAIDTAAAIIVAPPVEETVKALALVAIFLFMRHEIDSVLDGIIYGAMVGMGFAMVENFFYFIAIFAEEGADAWGVTIFLRTIVFGLNHSLFTSASGLGLAISRFSRDKFVRYVAPVGGWCGAVVLHAIHNLGASSGGLLCLLLPVTDWGGVALVLIIIVWALLQERRWIDEYLREEVVHGTLTAQQYARACSLRGRLGHRLELLFRRGPRAYLAATQFYRQCSELAYKKHHYVLLEEEHSERLTLDLREELRSLSRDLR